MSPIMRRNRSTWLSWNVGWRVRAVQLALALGAMGLVTAATAAIGSKRVGGDGGMAQLILAQQIAQGTPPASSATAPPAPGGAQPAAQAGTPPASGSGAPPMEGLKDTPAARAAILTEAAAIEKSMNDAIAHTEKLRTAAYAAKDIIRLNTITAKLDEMRQILAIAQPAFDAIREPGQDIFVMKAKLSTIQQGNDRMKEDEATAEAAEGDSVDTVTASGIENATSGPNAGGADPTLPGNPTDNPGLVSMVDRPGQASPYK